MNDQQNLTCMKKLSVQSAFSHDSSMLLAMLCFAHLCGCDSTCHRLRCSIIVDFSKDN